MVTNEMKLRIKVIGWILISLLFITGIVGYCRVQYTLGVISEMDKAKQSKDNEILIDQEELDYTYLGI